ncbi:polysaccharide biosynthesis/export family protein [Terrimonas sp. NA20]|uniref:Polysaccharide biosynthesis/export family protein n=1 Tax=Terrimonas ginsenosidimutans TaxID=2908004 RepID=A0ABS9L0G0_9BACT|nr:polysaccharide biosynthesis/export family protein [Terrimonas ginsenosidimutans]MCG2618071.1 polysaccharide biosynthesis/export family protein [Terrimonas ginsenosidimutans]
MKNSNLLGLIVPLVLLYSCRTSKQLPYFQDLSDTATVQTIATAKAPPLSLQADDQVQVSISSPSAEATSFFNLITANPSPSTGTLSNSSSVNQSFINVYVVSTEGRITMPILGDIQAAGLTLEQLRQKVVVALKPYLTNAIVSTRLINFKVTVIGEVSKPFTVPVNGEKINVIEAIGASGDMTVFGSRKKVKVIRKLPDGNTEVAKLDFNSSSVFQSPYFNLRQNDIVYVQPNKNKGFLADNTTFWASMILSVASILTIILTRN